MKKRPITLFKIPKRTVLEERKIWVEWAIYHVSGRISHWRKRVVELEQQWRKHSKPEDLATRQAVSLQMLTIKELTDELEGMWKSLIAKEAFVRLGMTCGEPNKP